MPQSILDCGSYLVELDAGTQNNGFTLDSASKGVLGGVNYVLGGVAEFFDVTANVFSVNIFRGRRDWDGKIEPGQCTLQLFDPLGYFTVTNSASPYWNVARGRLGFEPTRRMRVSRDGWYLFVGQIVDYSQQVTIQNQSIITISGSDDLLSLNNKVLLAHTPVAQKSGARVGAVLSRAEVGLFAGVGERSLAVGEANLGAAPVEAGVSVKDYLDRVNNSEYGRIFMSRSGVLNFDSRVGRELDGVDVAFTHAEGTGIPFNAFEIAYS